MIEGTHLEHWINNITLGAFLSEGCVDDGSNKKKKKKRRSKATIMEPGGVIDKSNVPKTNESPF